MNEGFKKDVPKWAVKATEDVISEALRDWDKAYHELANELHEQKLAHVVAEACGTRPDPTFVWRPSSKDNSTWDLLWEELTPEQRAAAEKLGYTQDEWWNRAWPFPRDAAWAELPSETRDGLTILGESVATWDKWENGPKWW